MGLPIPVDDMFADPVATVALAYHERMLREADGLDMITEHDMES